MKILLIDPSQDFQSVLAEALAGRVATLRVALSIAEGLNELSVDDIDLICIVQPLPDGEASALLGQIRRQPAYRYTPIVLLTDETATSESEWAVDQGASEVFGKQEIGGLLEFINGIEERSWPLVGRVLFVEKSAANAHWVGKCALGLEVDWYSNAEDAWDAFLDTTYDLVVADIDLSGKMNAVAFVNGIRRLDGGKGGIPILALAEGSAGAVNLFRMGINDFVAKAAIHSELLGRMYNLIGRPQMQDDARREIRQRFDRHLLALARSTLAANGNLQKALVEVASRAGSALGVQCSIWLLDDANRLCCKAHGGNGDFDVCECPTFSEQDLPNYFAALHRERIISAPNALTYPATKEMAVSYFIPKGIGALLDVPVRQESRLMGVVCLEHRYVPRQWTPEEEAFAAGVGEQVARLLGEYARWQSLQELQLANRVMQAAPLSIMITDPEQQIVFVNRAFEKITGYSRQEVLGQSPRMFASGCHDVAYYEAMWKEIHGNGIWQGEIYDRRKNGDVYPKRLIIKRLNSESGEVAHYVGMATDVSHEHAQQDQIRHLAFHDSLTGLANRALFTDRLKQALIKAERTGQRVAVLYIDVDRFKVINDSFGHPVGDGLLKEIGHRLQHCLRDGDTLSRQGGDEFLVIIDDLAGLDRLTLIAKRMLEQVAHPFLVDGKSILPHVSIGISVFPEDADNETVLVKNADMAMYQAKAMGRNQYQYFTDELNEKTQRRAHLESDLRRALACEGELYMVYQPKVSTMTGEILGLEALVRWSPSPEQSIPPDLFIEIAEEAHLIQELGQWIVNTVLGQMRTWQGGVLDGLPVAINISPIQFKEPGFVDFMVERCSWFGISPGQVELEITEGVFIGDVKMARAILNEVKNAGFLLTLDDFGKGYSSFSYLASLPLDTVKIDRSFVWKLGKNPRNAAILKAIIALSQELGLGLVAEGVETLEQVLWLREAGAQIAQGYYFSRPELAEVLLGRLDAAGERVVSVES